MDNRVGQQLGNYLLVRLLGRGGFAEVYLGEHIRLKTQAAIKVLHTTLGEDDKGGFLSEAQTLARLKHPHIVSVFDFDVNNHMPFLVMDYFSEGNIRRHYPKNKPLPLPTIVSYIEQVASALQYAHREKIIHRDIKPENMLLDKNNNVVLSDFGIAIIAQSTRNQNTEKIAGTAPYIAPEQFQGHPRRASDQYALAIVTYEWLTGSLPFTGSFSEIASQHMFIPPPPLREKNASISPNVEAVVLKALEKDPHKRFESVQEFANALAEASKPTKAFPPTHATMQSSLQQLPPSQRRGEENNLIHLAHLPTLASGLSQPTTTKTSPLSGASVTEPVPSLELSSHNRNISRRGLLLGLTGLVVASGGISWLLYSKTHSASSPFTSSRSISSTTSTRNNLGTTVYLTYRGHAGNVNAVDWSPPDGKYLASIGSDQTVQIWDATTGSNLYTHGHAGWESGMDWAPDGNRIASGMDDFSVQTWDARSGAAISTYRGLTSDVGSVDWAPDGTRIVTTGRRDRLVYISSAVDGRHVYTYYAHTSIVFIAAWSPDSKAIASGGFDRTVQVWDPTSGGGISFYQGHSQQIYGLAWSPDGKYIASAGADQTVQVWNAANGDPIYTYNGHSGFVYTVAWSPDGKHIASAGADKTVQVWNPTDGSNPFTYRGHSNFIYALAWSPDSKRIASGSLDKTVQVWQAV